MVKNRLMKFNSVKNVKDQAVKSENCDTASQQCLDVDLQETSVEMESKIRGSDFAAKTPKPKSARPVIVKKVLKEENKFITDLLSLMVFPKHGNEADSDSEVDDVSREVKKELLMKKSETTRASTYSELQERLQHKLQELRGQNGTRNGKKMKLSKAEKRLKSKQEKKIKSKLAKVSKTDQNNFGMKMAKAAQKIGAKPSKPVFNAEGKMVFSKFDFTDDAGLKTEEQKKPTLDPKSALSKLQKQKQKLKTLEDEGQAEKAQAMQEKAAWMSALERAGGAKVKDDPSLLKKSIKRLEKRKKQSKKKWESRVENEEKWKSAKQQKRSDNLLKRKKDKKEKTMKKKGRMVAGFR